MNNSIPSITDLYQIRDTREKSKYEMFNIVLNKIIQNIKFTNSNTEKTFVIFEIPRVLIGYPMYNIKACIFFIMDKLTNNGYIIDFIEPYYLYIDWGTSNKQQQKSTKVLASYNILEKHKDKLKNQTKAFLSQFPNTSEIEFIYEPPKPKSKKQLKKKPTF